MQGRRATQRRRGQAELRGRGAARFYRLKQETRRKQTRQTQRLRQSRGRLYNPASGGDCSKLPAVARRDGEDTVAACRTAQVRIVRGREIDAFAVGVLFSLRRGAAAEPDARAASPAFALPRGKRLGRERGRKHGHDSEPPDSAETFHSSIIDSNRRNRHWRAERARVPQAGRRRAGRNLQRRMW